jgi:branched-chain amino acid transport system permease protein
MFSPAIVAQVILNGLTLSAVYILVALGFTLIFGIMRIVNFAHGEFAMLGGFALFYLYGSLEINFFLALALASVGAALVGLVLERLVFRPFYGREFQGMIATLGLSVALQYVAVILWGADERAIPPAFTSSLQLGSVIFPLDRLAVVVVAATVLACFYAFMRFTRVGLAMRATAQDAEIAETQGVSSARIYTLALLVATSMAALAGGMLGQLYSLSPFLGQLPIMKSFVVVILGGLGSIPGAAAGGLILGMAESSLNTFYGGGIAELIEFAAIILVLIWRPWGLFGRAEA